MTVQDAVIEVFETLAEPSDLPIYNAGGAFDLAANGSVRILAALNRAQDYVSTYRRSNVGAKFFRCMEASATFEPITVSETLGTQVSPYKTVYLPATMSTSAAGRFNGWIYDDGTEVRRVLRHTIVAGVGQIVLDRALPETPATRTLVLRQRAFTLGAGADDISTDRTAIDVIRVRDIETQSELERADADILVRGLAPLVGIPGMFAKTAQGIMFDAAVSDSRSYEVDFYAYPVHAVAADEEFALPRAFHLPMVMHAAWWGFKRYSETTQAYSGRKDFEELMATVLSEIDVEDFFGGDYVRPQMR